MSYINKAKQEYKVLQEIADSMSSYFQVSLVRGVKNFKNKIQFNTFGKLILDGNIKEAEALIPWDRLESEFSEINNLTEEGIISGAEASINYMPVVSVSEFAFNAEHPRIKAFIKTNTANKVTAINEQSRNAIKRIINESIAQGLSQRDTAKLIENVVGLTERQALAVSNYKNGLIESGVKGKKLDDMVNKYSDRQLKLRAENIARTETMTAVNQGQKELWDQASDEGLFDKTKAKKRWIVTPDDRLCPICSPMRNQEVMYDAEFTSDIGNVIAPPLHPRCRCAVEIMFND